jgi:hypothetical protein
MIDELFKARAAFDKFSLELGFTRVFATEKIDLDSPMKEWVGAELLNMLEIRGGTGDEIRYDEQIDHFRYEVGTGTMRRAFHIRNYNPDKSTAGLLESATFLAHSLDSMTS